MSKTPVSMLQEHCARVGTVPQYDLVINGVGSHEPHFQYRLTVCDVVTIGDGKSKKEAKHEAARKAINILLPHSKEVNQELAASFGKTLHLSEDPPREEFFSPYQHVVKQNFVGILATISASKSLPEPKYIFVGEVGLPHAKTFTYECHVANIKECASARTKQQAKHLAASNMIERLSKVFGDIMLDDIEKEEIDEASKAAKKVFSKLSTKRIGEPLKNIVKDYFYFDIHTFFDNSPLLNDLPGYSTNMDENSSDPSELLTKLFESCGKEVIYTFMPSSEKRIHSVSICQMNSAPYFVTLGMGLTNSEAQLKAAHKLLCILKSFM